MTMAPLPSSSLLLLTHPPLINFLVRIYFCYRGGAEDGPEEMVEVSENVFFIAMAGPTRRS